jgi:hypothetical protein
MNKTKRDLRRKKNYKALKKVGFNSGEANKMKDWSNRRVQNAVAHRKDFNKSLAII